MFDFNSIRRTAAQVASNINEVGMEIEEKKRLREEMKELPLPREDFINMLFEHIDEQGGKSSRSLKLSFKSAMVGYVETCSPILEGNNGGSFPGVAQPMHIYNFFGDLMKDSLRKEIMSWDWPTKVGVARKDRVAFIEKLDKEIAKLESKYDDLKSKANAAGLRVG